jgi:glycosyltransferase involved in cell wall biosynthesis
MKLSVALCTYNGEQFLPLQLAGITEQSRLPDELVVCDDGSTDGTVAMVKAYAASVSFPVRLIENRTNLGVTANFEQAIRHCQGELIALSDQDDVWYPDRLARSEEALAADARAVLVFSDADLMDDHSHPEWKTLWKRLGFTGERKRAFLAGNYGVLAKHRYVTGATMMFRSALRERCLPIPNGWIHDEWIAMIAAAFGELRAIDEALIRYRLHSAQQVGLTNKLEQRAQGTTAGEKHRSRVAESAKELRQLCDALSEMDSPRPDVLAAYREQLRFLEFRAGLPRNRLSRMGAVLTHVGKYGKHASGVASMVKDLTLD